LEVSEEPTFSQRGWKSSLDDRLEFGKLGGGASDDLFLPWNCRAQHDALRRCSIIVVSGGKVSIEAEGEFRFVETVDFTDR
jgi:hypothetical protein